ncbi:hypothetical protein, partial [Nocardia sp. CC201C]|uniref:hypothetical protein n=1 Tax=Nocardia sp. CC201C TaxID=3044575 RepID=UPI0024A927D2
MSATIGSRGRSVPCGRAAAGRRHRTPGIAAQGTHRRPGSGDADSGADHARDRLAGDLTQPQISGA